MRCEPYNLRAADNDAAILLAVCEDRYDWHALAVFDALRGLSWARRRPRGAT
jgi:hypothetical protein